MKSLNETSSWLKASDRINQVGEYFFSKKLQEIAQMQKSGAKIINLGIGNPDLAPSPSAIEGLIEDAKKSDANGYQPYRGVSELREAVGKWYKKWYDVELTPDKEILPLMGSKEGIMHITWALTNPGDEVLIPNPGYPTYSAISQLAGLKINYFDLTEENHWEPNFEELEKLDLEKIKLMWVNYPNMPTGQKASPELFKRLVGFGKKHQIIIINDNPYSFILEDKPLSLLQTPGAKDICLELNSLSKSHNMAGWRIGMLCGNQQLVEWVSKIHSNITSGQYRPIQKATIKALESSACWHKSNNEIYKTRKNIAWELLDALGCKYDKNQSGLFVWAKTPKDINCDLDYSDEILYKTHVFITPGSIFGSNGKGYIRISLCSDEHSLKKALDRIKNNSVNE